MVLVHLTAVQYSSRDEVFLARVGLFVGRECAVLIVGEKFIFTRR
jgi:hypothetical protein